MACYQSLGQTHHNKMEGLQKAGEDACATAGGEGSLNPGSSPLRIVLVGKSGSGKSATGNSILCQHVFKSKLGTQPVTRTCQGATGTWQGRSILVVDTPSIFEAKAQDQEMEDLAGESLHDYVANTDNLRLRSLVQECGSRYCAFNNRASAQEQRDQLAELMAMLEGLEREHQGAFLSNDLFFEAQMLQRGEAEAPGEGRRHYLAKVLSHIEKQKQDLRQARRHRVLRGLLRVKNWIVSHDELCVCLVWCSFLFLLILLIIWYHL